MVSRNLITLTPLRQANICDLQISFCFILHNVFRPIRTKGIKLSLLGSLRLNVTGVEGVITRKPWTLFHNTLHLSDGNHRHPCLNTGCVFQCIFLCIIKHNQLIFLLCLLWELVSIFWQIFATLLTNDKLIAIYLRLQWISDSEFWTVCLGF